MKGMSETPVFCTTVDQSSARLAIEERLLPQVGDSGGYLLALALAVDSCCVCNDWMKLPPGLLGDEG